MMSKGVEGVAPERIASCFEVLSHPIRVSIVQLLLERQASWSELKKRLEERGLGRINPNTLSFHLSRLIEAGLVEKLGSEATPIYTLKVTKDAIRKLLEDSLKVCGQK